LGINNAVILTNGSMVGLSQVASGTLNFTHSLTQPALSYAVISCGNCFFYCPRKRGQYCFQHSH